MSGGDQRRWWCWRGEVEVVVVEEEGAGRAPDGWRGSGEDKRAEAKSRGEAEQEILDTLASLLPAPSLLSQVEGVMRRVGCRQSVENLE